MRNSQLNAVLNLGWHKTTDLISCKAKIRNSCYSSSQAIIDAIITHSIERHGIKPNLDLLDTLQTIYYSGMKL